MFRKFVPTLVLVLVASTSALAQGAGFPSRAKAQAATPAVDTTKKDTTTKAVVQQASPVPAQKADTGGHPYVKGTVTKAQYALAIERNDRRLLNVDCNAIVASVAKRVPRKLSSCRDLAIYIRTLVEAPLPQVETHLGRIKRGVVDESWKRWLRPGEMGLYDNNTGLWMFSLSCGNEILDELPVHTAMAEVSKPEPTVTATATATVDQPFKAEAEARAGLSTASAKADATATDDSKKHEEHHDSHLLRNTGYVVGGLVVLAGLVWAGVELYKALNKPTVIDLSGSGCSTSTSTSTGGGSSSAAAAAACGGAKKSYGGLGWAGQVSF